MKEFEITVRLKNNLLVQRRTEMGLLQHEFAKKAGVSFASYNSLETMHRSPIDGRTGGFTKVALGVAKYYGVSPVELWPDVVLGVVNNEVIRTMSADEAECLMAQSTVKRLSPPSVLLGEKQDAELLLAMVDKCLNEREKFVLTKRFGLNGNDGHTYQEIADVMKVTSERIRQIEVKALRKLRYSKSTDVLRGRAPVEGFFTVNADGERDGKVV